MSAKARQRVHASKSTAAASSDTDTGLVPRPHSAVVSPVFSGRVGVATALALAAGLAAVALLARVIVPSSPLTSHFTAPSAGGENAANGRTARLAAARDMVRRGDAAADAGAHTRAVEEYVHGLAALRAIGATPSEAAREVRCSLLLIQISI